MVDCTLLDRINERKIVTDTGCWVLPYELAEDIRPRIRFDGKIYLLSRILLWLDGKLDLHSKKLACHKCENEKCFNPEHLYVGTHLDNHNDEINNGTNIGDFKKKTYCINGHEFILSNTYYRSNGAKECKTCMNIRARKYYNNKKAQCQKNRIG